MQTGSQTRSAPVPDAWHTPEARHQEARTRSGACWRISTQRSRPSGVHSGPHLSAPVRSLHEPPRGRSIVRRSMDRPPCQVLARSPATKNRERCVTPPWRGRQHGGPGRSAGSPTFTGCRSQRRMRQQRTIRPGRPRRPSARGERLQKNGGEPKPTPKLGRTHHEIRQSAGQSPDPTTHVSNGSHEHPLVAPQVTHLRQVPLRTSVRLPHSSHGSPS